jgi:hypothetical protein
LDLSSFFKKTSPPNKFVGVAAGIGGGGLNLNIGIENFIVLYQIF